MKLEDVILSRFPDCDKEYLDKYLQICSSSALDGYSEKHHILPKHCWPEYEDFSIFPWNKVHLTAKDHALAHYYFAKCVNTYKSWYAVMAMFNLDNGSNHQRNFSDSDALTYSRIYEEYRETMKSEPHFNIGRNSPFKGIVRPSVSAGKLGKKLGKHHSDAVRAGKLGSKYSESHRLAMSVSNTKAQRKSEIWHEPIKRKLYDLWVNANNPGRCRFSKVCNDNGFAYSPTQLNILINEFRKLGYVEPL